MDVKRKTWNKAWHTRQGCRTLLAASVAAACASMAGPATAFEIETGIEDLAVRFDNTIRYNLGLRMQDQEAAIIGNPNNDDGDRNFDKHSIVTNRVDLLTEFDVVYRGDYGFRVSAASWYDAAYGGSFDNTSLATSNHLDHGQPAFGLSDYARRYYAGPSGEFLDAYVFGKIDLAGLPLRVRAGRHTVNWGESLLSSGAVHGIAYGQAPMDRGKALATPGIEAKELYLPRTQLSAQLQATPELSFAGQYFFEWRAARVPESGTYLGFADHYQEGGESLINAGVVGGRALHGDDLTPQKTGDWGVMARWRPQWLNGTVGFYVRNFSDTTPQTILLRNSKPQYFLNYGADVDMYGVSLSKQVGGISLGADLNYRENMPLVSDTVAITSAAALPARGELLGARGDTVHGVLNMLGTVASPLWDSASWAGEVTWSHWASVTQGENFFKGRAGKTDIDRVSRNAYSLAINFTPTWYQVFPGADLSMPLSYSSGISGNSAVSSGGNEGAGSYSIGLALDVESRYRFDLKYVGYFGDYTTDANGNLKTSNGTQSLLVDRSTIYLTFKTTL